MVGRRKKLWVFHFPSFSAEKNRELGMDNGLSCQKLPKIEDKSIRKIDAQCIHE